MGVPALFRWLSQKYPKIISQVIEEKSSQVGEEEIPLDITRPNPNGEEFDNLYLDMNGIVHPCSHPEDRPPPANEEEMMLAIFQYTERVFNMVRPRKLLLIAVDGVAPRAKMNQQRSRRFRSAQEAKEKDEDKEELMKMLKVQNGGVLREDGEAAVVKKTWDSNAITPGTPFMDILAASLRYWCAYKVNTDPAWEFVKVIISDATVPGEGEHKIMEFIRSQRASPQHDPNTRHVIYGLDADLIMLGLATHEPHFRVLREDVFFQESKARTCRLCGQKGHIAEACKGEVKAKEGEFGEKDKALADKPFIWLHVSILREYLEAELHVPGQGFDFDLERALDDWVFMCFFVGNDFLPHLPSLDIRENGIDTLIAIWRDNLPAMQGYLTMDGHVDLQKCQFILNGLAKQEDAIFRRRKETEDRKEANAKRRKLEQESRDGKRHATETRVSGNRERRGSPDYSSPAAGTRNHGRVSDPTTAPPDLPLFVPGRGNATREERAVTHDMVINRTAVYKADLANKSAAAALKSQLLNRDHNAEDSNGMRTTIKQGEIQEQALGGQEESNRQGERPVSTSRKRNADALESDDPSPPSQDHQNQTGKQAPVDGEAAIDNVRLWEQGYADRYYEQKFGKDPTDIAFRNKVANDYVEGLAWVLLYYFQGCPSWTWYYPHHYAPFAADFVGIDKLKMSFKKGQPFRPFEQLMGVLPAASNHAIPEVFRSLMTDEDSPILDFYPTDFPIDLNGKKFAWQGVALLPFIDEKRLLGAMATRYSLLSAEDVARNEMGKDVLIISDQHPLYDEIATNFYSKRQGPPKYTLTPSVKDNLAGKIEKNETYIPQSSLPFPLKPGLMPDLDVDHSVSVFYEIPHSIHIHKSMLLRGVKFAPATLDRADIEATKSQANRSGRSFGGAPFRGGHGNGRGRGGQMNYAANDRKNPFAPYVDPNFFPPNSYSRGPPPSVDRYSQYSHPSHNGSRQNGQYRNAEHVHSNSYNVSSYPEPQVDYRPVQPGAHDYYNSRTQEPRQNYRHQESPGYQRPSHNGYTGQGYGNR